MVNNLNRQSMEELVLAQLPLHLANDLTEYRKRPAETERVADLLGLLPQGLRSAIDIGARDGFISKSLSQFVPAVTALDLERPHFVHPGVQCVQGDATALEFDVRTFDLVLCAEVLEHIPSPSLEMACRELARVANSHVLIGVPYKQDIRDAKTTCYTCGGINPPWGHVNVFDEKRLAALFPTLKIAAISYVGVAQPRTNVISSSLMTFAGNPYGTYVQDELCIHCNSKLTSPPERTLTQKIATKVAVRLKDAQALVSKRRPNWIHVLFSKDVAQA